jgi:restriction system protein
VTRAEVMALVGEVYVDKNVSKAIVTTTSHFAPKLLTDEKVKGLMPHQLELRARDGVLAWLDNLSTKRIIIP